MKILIAGDSHTVTLRRGYSALRGERKSPDPALFDITLQGIGPGNFLAQNFFEDRGDHALMTIDACRRNFDRIPPSNAQYEGIGLSGPLHSTRIWRHDWTQFSVSGASGPTENAVTSSVLGRIIDDDAGSMLALLALLQRNNSVFVIEGPWPFRHHPAVKRNGPEKILTIHHAYRTRVLTKLKAMGVAAIEVDPSWIDEDGFMGTRFRSDNSSDHHHANPLFGSLMMAKVEMFLSQPGFVRQGGKLP